MLHYFNHAYSSFYLHSRSMEEEKMVLPPGLQFDPTDEELIVSFLRRRAANLPCYPHIIPDLDFYAAHPLALHEKAFWSKKEWYFFSILEQNRSTEKGFWKEVGLSEPIFTTNGDNEVIGIKNYLVFIRDDGCQTNWVMEEYRLLNYHFTSSQILGQNQRHQDMKEWVVCRVREGNIIGFEEKISNEEDKGVELSYLDEVFFSMDEDDDQDDITFPT